MIVAEALQPKKTEARNLIRRIRRKIRLPAPLFKMASHSKPRFECPICHYQGPFRDMDYFAGRRLHAECPQCGSLERHRLQYLVVMEILDGRDLSKWRMLHCAPEPFLSKIFSSRVCQYETADISKKGVQHHVDLQNLPFKDGTYDFIFASHVLEHIPDDNKAIKEIRRVLKAGGIAILPVPIVCEKTIEYEEPNPHESYHMRAPGLDYFDKYRPHFAKVESRNSADMPEKYQIYIYEDRTLWPTPECPLRPPMPGRRHIDFVPICYA